MDGVDDISTVMTEVLMHMGRIVDIFRSRGEIDAANAIAKNTIASARIVNDTMAPWDTTTTTIAQPPSNGATRPLLLNDVASIPSHFITPRTESRASISSPITWAAVAAVAPAQGNRLIRFTPEDSVQTIVSEPQGDVVVTDTDVDKRVIWIRGWSAEKNMAEVTDKVGQGPIYSMAYSERDCAVCIIFQSSFSAKSLFVEECQHVEKNGHSRFGPGCDVIEGLPFPDNDDIRRMSPPNNERRRLTFARAQLFTNGLTEARFKNDLYTIVGEKNVELVWLFNTGNATVVLSAMPLARLVRGHFIKMARNPNSAYHGVAITFSHDPCERPMTLITQMQSGRALRPATTYGYISDSPIANMARAGPPNRRNTAGEADGWHTVSRRR